MPRRQYSSLREALDAHQHAPENTALIERLCAHIGIAGYTGNSDNDFSPIRGTRAGEGPDLLINWGWTEGFVDEAEARAASDGWGTCTLGSDGRWYVAHPLNRLRDGDGASRRGERPVGLCPVHHTALPATGVCDDCA